MSHDERIKEYEERERALMLQSIEGARAGAVSPSLHLELAEVRAELKTARRVKAWDEKRTDPKLTRKVTIMLSEDEHKKLSSKAEAMGIDLSKYIRELLKCKSGGESPF